MTTVDPAALDDYNAGVERARDAYDVDNFAAGKRDARLELMHLRSRGYISYAEYRAELQEIEQW